MVSQCDGFFVTQQSSPNAAHDVNAAGSRQRTLVVNDYFARHGGIVRHLVAVQVHFHLRVQPHRWKYLLHTHEFDARA